MYNIEQKDEDLFVSGNAAKPIVSRSQFKPILFSTAMVEAIMSGNKTQTRRKVPTKVVDAYYDYDDWASSVGKPEGVSCTRTYEKEYFMDRCKYSVGDILWVRETWQITDFLHPSDENYGYVYKASENGRDWEANDESWKWKPSIFMPKEACRLFLEVTDVRVEELHKITNEDAVLEGVETLGFYPGYDVSSRGKFEWLWSQINGVESWEGNPWVYVVTFKIVECPQGFC